MNIDFSNASKMFRKALQTYGKANNLQIANPDFLKKYSFKLIKCLKILKDND